MTPHADTGYISTLLCVFKQLRQHVHQNTEAEFPVARVTKQKQKCT